jgi:very-short-patch-repair endonuclease
MSEATLAVWLCLDCVLYNSVEHHTACYKCGKARGDTFNLQTIGIGTPAIKELIEVMAREAKKARKGVKAAKSTTPKLTEEQDLEEKFFRYWEASQTGYELTRQHRGIFKHVNKRGKLIMTNHRFDFALPALKLAIEVQGGIFSRGRHVRPQGYHDDRAKMRKAQAQGWVVFEFTTLDIKDNNLHNVVHEILAEVKTLETIYVEQRRVAA